MAAIYLFHPSAVLQTFLSAEGCSYLAEGLRFDCGQYGSFAVFVVCLQFPVVLCGCRMNHVSLKMVIKLMHLHNIPEFSYPLILGKVHPTPIAMSLNSDVLHDVPLSSNS